MKGKRPTPLECPVCTSREVVTRGWPYPVAVKRTPKPKVIRYRCKQCGHKFEMPKS